MANNNVSIEEALIISKPTKCSLCKGGMKMIAIGEYNCVKCGHEELDDLGKVRRFLEENGPSDYGLVVEATGVDPTIVKEFLEHGKVEIPEHSKYYLVCQRCGCSLKMGKYCPECYKELTSGMKRALDPEILGEKPVAERKTYSKGKMYFLNRDR